MRLIEFLKESNRWKHLLVGFFLGFFLSVLVAAFAGFMKEYYDKKRGGLFDVTDLVVTIIGGSIGQCAIILFWYKIYPLL